MPSKSKKLMKMTLAQLIAEQEKETKKISLHEGLLASLEKVLSDGVEKAVEEFRTEAEQEKENLLAELKIKTEEAADYVNSLTPIKGDQGNKPVAGIDYPIPKNGKTPKKGVDYFDGYTPIKNKDYFDGQNGSQDTGTEIVEKINLQDEQIDASKIKNLPKQVSIFGGGGSSRRAYFKIVSLTGTIDGSNTRFYLPQAPRRGAELFLMLDNSPQELTQNYLLKGNVIDYTFAPQTGQRHYAIIFHA